MKKSLFLFSFIAIVSLSFSSCNFANSDDDLLNAPSVTSKESINSIAITHERLSSTNERVNIERINVSQSKAEPVLIATLYPNKISTDLLTYQDRLIYKGTKYKYRFIFIDSETKKYYTDWSDAVKAQEGYTEASTPYLSYNTSGGASLLYDDTGYKLELSSGTTIPPLNTGNTVNVENFTDDFSPVLVLKAGDTSVAFDLTADILDGTESIFFDLQKLPLNFYNKPIYILGIAAKHQVKPNSSDVTGLDWTELVPLNVYYKKSTSEKVKYITIDPNTSTGTPFN